MSTTTASRLAPGTIYFGDNGRAMCRDCAGHTATVTGRDLNGTPLQAATAEDVAIFANYDMVVACEGGHLTLTVVDGTLVAEVTA